MPNRPQDGGSAKRGQGEIDPLVAKVIDGLNEAMEKAGSNPTQIAKRTELDQGNLSRVMRKEVPNVTFIILAKVAMHLNVSLDDLLTGPRPMFTEPVRRLTPVPSSSVVPSRPGR